MVLFYLLVALILLTLNGFFVLAEFAAVKMRSSRIEELLDKKVPGANAVRIVHDHLDEYLSVCQLGITFASIGLGFVAEPAVVRIIEPIVNWTGLFPHDSQATWVTAHAIAFSISYLLVSFSHILFGELVPKSIAIRLTDRASLWSAGPLRVIRIVLYLPLMVMNLSANLILRAIGLGGMSHHDVHSESEIRILISHSQSQGLMSFRRLLFMENVFDLGELRVRDAMRPKSQVRCLDMSRPWEENVSVIRRYRFSRYPIVPNDRSDPIGLVHLKDFFLAGDDDVDLDAIKRPIIWTQDSSSLESLLSEMQKKRIHAALVRDQAGNWVGYLTLEDAIEEIIGTIRDEFEDEEQIDLAEALIEDRIQLGIEATSTIEAIRKALARIKPESLPIPKDRILRAIEERERIVESYLGSGFGMPHARIQGLTKPVVLIIQSKLGIPYRDINEKAFVLIVLLTPAGQPRIHQRLQAIVATILDESEYIPDRLRHAHSPAEILEVLRTGEQAALD